MQIAPAIFQFDLDATCPCNRRIPLLRIISVVNALFQMRSVLYALYTLCTKARDQHI